MKSEFELSDISNQKTICYDMMVLRLVVSLLIY